MHFAEGRSVWKLLIVPYSSRMTEMLPNFAKAEKPTGETLKLYEEIVIKNFEILKTLLPRMNSLYQLNEELERSVSNIETRLVKMENDQENLHYEMRTSHLAIDSKLSSIILEYNNISAETSKVKKQTDALSKEIKEAKTKHLIEKSQKEIIPEPQSPAPKEKSEERIKKLAFAEKDEVFPMLLKNRIKSIVPPKRSSINLENNDSPCQSPKVHFNIEPPTQRNSEKNIAASLPAEQSALESARKTTFKSNKSSLNLSAAKSQKQIKTSKSIQQIAPSDAKSFEKFLKEIEDYHFHNQKMKQNYEELMEEYEKTNQFSFNEINEKISSLTARLNELDPENNLMDSIKNAMNLELLPKFQQIASAIEEKIDRKLFERIIMDFNSRILGIHEERKKIANRDETKRALEFLEKKINSVLNDYYEAKQRSLHHVSVDKKGCLRAADLLQDRDPKDYNRENVIQSQTAANTPRAVRNDSARSSKRQAASLHSRIMNGAMTENRFNEKEWRPISTEKGEPHNDASNRKQDRSKNVNLLKKKAYEILDREKGKERPRLKKQRLIFQYD